MISPESDAMLALIVLAIILCYALWFGGQWLYMRAKGLPDNKPDHPTKSAIDADDFWHTGS